MIKNWWFQGDIHANVNNLPKDLTEKDALIILGDVGFNLCDKQATERQIKGEYLRKQYANSLGYLIYCVRGNHELRPEQVHPEFKCTIYYDDNVGDIVYIDPHYPNLRYFIDGEDYWINNYRTLVIGGAYSVDKYYRLQRNLFWNSKEQLDEKERDAIDWKLSNSFCFYDLILTHTCPYEWQPTDLFLDIIDQSSVDNTTEKWLQKIKERVQFQYWLFGHFHRDRYINYELPKGTNIPQQTIMLYNNKISLTDLFKIKTYKDRPEWMDLSRWMQLEDEINGRD